MGPSDRVVSMLTGDFLAPYLLSSIDAGKGMMDAINATPIDYLTWVSLLTIVSVLYC